MVRRRDRSQADSSTVAWRPSPPGGDFGAARRQARGPPRTSRTRRSAGAPSPRRRPHHRSAAVAPRPRRRHVIPVACRSPARSNRSALTIPMMTLARHPAATAAAIAAGVIAAACSSSTARQAPAPAAASITQRAAGEDRFVDSVLARMTLAEKLGQLDQRSGTGAPTGPGGTGARIDEIRRGLVGSVFNVIGADSTRALQRVAVEQSRLHIPQSSSRGCTSRSSSGSTSFTAIAPSSRFRSAKRRAGTRRSPSARRGWPPSSRRRTGSI